MDIFSVLNKIEKIEQKASELYHHYHTLFLNDEEASFFFYKMSVEEKGHRNLAQYVKRLARQNPKLFGDVDFSHTDLAKIENRLDSELNRKPNPSLMQAIDIAEELEITCAEAYLRNLPLKANPILTDLNTSLGEKDHTEKITAFRTKINLRY